jgi:hypothetical protein
MAVAPLTKLLYRSFVSIWKMMVEAGFPTAQKPMNVSRLAGSADSLRRQ